MNQPGRRKVTGIGVRQRLLQHRALGQQIVLFRIGADGREADDLAGAGQLQRGSTRASITPGLRDSRAPDRNRTAAG